MLLPKLKGSQMNKKELLQKITLKIILRMEIISF